MTINTIALSSSGNSKMGKDAYSITVGKDVLELLSSSMYIEPMTIYREYAQNAADAIDEARQAGLLGEDEPGYLTITIDDASRSVRLRDNGAGLASDVFRDRLTALGASRKRGTAARGFRGVGRLAGLGYCRELIFRSRAEGETAISELRWDCRQLRNALSSTDFKGGLTELVRDVVAVRRIPSEGESDRFFEVELKGIVRHRNDRLLSAHAIAEYLAQVAPVPFAPDFLFGKEIEAALGAHIPIGNLHISISGIDEPVYRPHRNNFELADGASDEFNSLDFIEIPSFDGGVGAVGWILHHGYTGAIPTNSLIKGLRLRCGNIQVGGHSLLEELFPETRFNAWSVGEIHIVDKNVIPNGRRDHFQQCVQFDHLLTHLAPVTRDIARRCRISSTQRKKLKDFEIHTASAREHIGIIKQNSLDAPEREKISLAARRSLLAMEKIVEDKDLDGKSRNQLQPVVNAVQNELKSIGNDDIADTSPLASVPGEKRAMYEHLFSLIYECSVNRVVAKALVDRILVKISTEC